MSSFSADLLLYGGRVLTLDPQHPEAEAVAVANGKILAVGTESELKPFCSLHTQLLACSGKTILPGFIDPHLHLFSWASRFCGVDVSAASSISEVQRLLRQQLVTTSANEWVRGYGYDEFFLAEKRHLTRRDLDAVSQARPILVRHRTGHAAVLNSAALQLTGIDQKFQSPVGGFVERDAIGQPTGMTYELESFLRTAIPSLALEDFAFGVQQVGTELLRQGVTSFHDASAGNTLEDLSVFRRLYEEGTLVSRATIMLGIDALPAVIDAGLVPFAGDGHVRLGSIKIMVHESRGVLHPEPEALVEMVWQAHSQGFQVAIHAVEEGPICIALNAIAQAQTRFLRMDYRHRIEHCSLCPPPFLDMLASTGSAVVTQPNFLHFYGEKYVTEIDASLHTWLYRMKSLAAHGIHVAGSSDCPIAPLAPLIGVSAAMTRQLQNGAVLNPEERLSLFEALSLFTSAGAWVGFEEKTKGRIKPGMLADLIILDKDIAKIAHKDLGEVKVQTTIIGGKIVWTAGEI